MATILAVDDAEVMRNMMRVFLTKHGHEVLLAADGKEAMQLARSRTIDLVLSDINMPGMSGISLVHKLRRLKNCEDIPIIMITTETSDYKKDKAKDTGASGWISKPITEQRLINAVDSMLGGFS